MNGSVTAALALLELADGEALEVAAASETVIAWAHARQLRSMQQVAQEQPAVLDPTGRLSDPAPAEVAAKLHWGTGAARYRLELAHDLTVDLPGVLHAMSEGAIDLPKAGEIARATCEMDPADRADLSADAIDYAAGHTRAQLRAWLAREVAAIDPDAVHRRRRRATKDRRVWITPEPDGMAALGAYLTAEEAQACWNALTNAAANIEGGIDPARADTLIALLTGTQVGTPVAVQVIIAEDGPELAGHGPISLSHSLALCIGASMIRLSAPTASIGYRPSARLNAWVRARDRHCRFPGCRRPATACDLDHVVPWPAGSTNASNLTALCRYHHRLKTHTGWQVKTHPDHVLEWTSPRGHTYFTSLHDP